MKARPPARSTRPISRKDFCLSGTNLAHGRNMASTMQSYAAVIEAKNYTTTQEHGTVHSAMFFTEFYYG